jgi:uncharacterized membrane protein YecN with MAPEG domain
MHMILLPISLLTAAAVAILNLWLGWRIAELRQLHKVSVGDGGEETLLRRMRAQANFIEHAPFFLILLAGLELAGANRLVLALVALLFILARIAHGYGMDGGSLTRWRTYGIISSTIATMVLTIWAIVRALEALSGG